MGPVVADHAICESDTVHIVKLPFEIRHHLCRVCQGLVSWLARICRRLQKSRHVWRDPDYPRPTVGSPHSQHGINHLKITREVVFNYILHTLSERVIHLNYHTYVEHNIQIDLFTMYIVLCRTNNPVNVTSSLRSCVKGGSHQTSYGAVWNFLNP